MQLSNKGGLVMPVIIEWTYKDGTKEVEKIPAQIWRKNEGKITKLFMKDKEVATVKLDPMRETADIDESNNSWPKEIVQSKFQVSNMATAPKKIEITTNLLFEASDKQINLLHVTVGGNRKSTKLDYPADFASFEY